MCESVSMVPPDFEETMKRVLSRSIWRSTSRIAPGSVESSTCRLMPPGTSPYDRRITSGPRLDPPMPSSTACSRPSAFADSANSRSSLECSSVFPLPRLDPPERGPPRRVRQPRLDRLRPVGDDPLAPKLNAPDKRVEGVHELLDPLAQQRLCHVAHIDARRGEPLEVLG